MALYMFFSEKQFSACFEVESHTPVLLCLKLNTAFCMLPFTLHRSSTLTLEICAGVTRYWTSEDQAARTVYTCTYAPAGADATGSADINVDVDDPRAVYLEAYVRAVGLCTEDSVSAANKYGSQAHLLALARCCGLASVLSISSISIHSFYEWKTERSCGRSHIYTNQAVHTHARCLLRTFSCK